MTKASSWKKKFCSTSARGARTNRRETRSLCRQQIGSLPDCLPPRFPLPSCAVAMPKDNVNERIVSAPQVEDDASFELKLRPQRSQEFIGQAKVKENMAVAIG